MWNYLGPTDPNRMSPKEFVKDKVWSRLDRVLQLRAQESLKGKPRPLHVGKLSNLVCSPLLILCLFTLLLSCILTLSHPFHRDSEFTSPGRIFQRGRRVRRGKPPRRR